MRGKSTGDKSIRGKSTGGQSTGAKSTGGQSTGGMSTHRGARTKGGSSNESRRLTERAQGRERRQAAKEGRVLPASAHGDHAMRHQREIASSHGEIA